MGSARAIASAAAPDAAAALAAAIAAGAVESLVAGAGPWSAAAATGCAALFAAPVGFAASASARALWRSWRPLAIEPSAAPIASARVAAALGFALAAALLVGAAGSLGSLAATSMTHVPTLAALTVGGFATGGALLAVVLSVPATRALAGLFAPLDRPRGPDRLAVSPARVLAVGAAIGGAAAVLAWLALLVAAWGRTDIGAAPYVVTAALALVGAHAVAARLGRRARPAGVAVVIVAAALAVATIVAVRDGAALGDARLRAPVGGRAIETLFEAPGR
ncbi:MAG TPA: hypothetical protein VK698_14385 [Kofleriaceae bacterium]|nr:hypothetical protein [Kofleriaceae bacterium]